MFELGSFSLTDMFECSAALRRVCEAATSMEEAARATVGYLRDNFVEKSTGEPSLSLVRFYKTHPYDRLEPDLQDYASAATPGQTNLSGVRCLTLLATAGEEPAWNNRALSRGHKAIPLLSTEAVDRMPMVSRLIAQLGFDVADLIDHEAQSIHDLEQRAHNVFYVPEARDSEHVPAQNDFVIPYGIRSVLGFGGLLPDRSLFAVVMFSSTPIPPLTADVFAAVALSVKVAMLRFVDDRTFESDPPADVSDPMATAQRELRIKNAEIETFDQLLDARKTAVMEQSERLERALQDAEERATDLERSQAELDSSRARKAAIFDGAIDSVISMDSDGRILEFNPAAEETFGYSRDEAVGELLADLIIPDGMRERHSRGLASYLETGEGPVLNRRIEVNALRRDGTEFPVELSVTPVQDVDPPIFTGYVRDITERRRAETELLDGRERLAHVARTLQASLLPPSLPDVPGIELASAYRAAGEGNDVGGDFYDVFELADGRWALALGDVCGKGPEAAALTALARYTLRAAAMRSASPGAVLHLLNEAIQRQHPESFCTVAYAVLDAERRRLTLASGGHPDVLLVGSTGEVTALEAGGPLLGPLPDWKGVERAVDLATGDVLVLYSDGVTEARRGQDFFGDERLSAVISDAAGLDAASIVARIETAVLDFAGALSDDLAILVARVLA
ncbi:MAG: phosphoserine phosphatase RsbU/P [Acidimicrobiaceae bacterium]